MRYIYPVLPLAEKRLIARVRERATAIAGVLRGIGDDCAVVRISPGHEALVTTDFSLEGVHFRRAWHPPESVGHRCLARGLSDIAAMGGKPLAAFLSLALPATLPQRWVDRFIAGFLRLAERFRVPLAGGDTASSPKGILADIVVLGSVPRGTAILRSGANPGDAIYVTGTLGASAAALKALQSGRKLTPSAHPAHFFPTPRLPAGKALRERHLASAMIDLSDGLSSDLAHICEESGVGAVVYADRMPVAVDQHLALHGGEDYELLFTSARPVPRKIGGVAITRIGEIVPEHRVTLVDASGRRCRLQAAGWEHFRSRS